MTFKHLDRIARCKRYRTADLDLLTCDLVSVKLENSSERNSSLIAVTSASPVSSALDKEYFPYKAIIWFELNSASGPVSRPTSPRAGDSRKATMSNVTLGKKTKENSTTNRNSALDPTAQSAKLATGYTAGTVPNSNQNITGSLQLPISLTRNVEPEVPESRLLGAPSRADPRVTTPRASVSFHPVISSKSGKTRYLYSTSYWYKL